VHLAAFVVIQAATRGPWTKVPDRITRQVECSIHRQIPGYVHAGIRGRVKSVVGLSLVGVVDCIGRHVMFRSVPAGVHPVVLTRDIIGSPGASAGQGKHSNRAPGQEGCVLHRLLLRG
jgi:hypothetical protein